jgi:hypothetical protein
MGRLRKNSFGVWSSRDFLYVSLMTRILTLIAANRRGCWARAKNFLTLKLIKNPCAEKEAILNSFETNFPG